MIFLNPTKSKPIRQVSKRKLSTACDDFVCLTQLFPASPSFSVAFENNFVIDRRVGEWGTEGSQRVVRMDAGDFEVEIAEKVLSCEPDNRLVIHQFILGLMPKLQYALRPPAGKDKNVARKATFSTLGQSTLDMVLDYQFLRDGTNVTLQLDAEVRVQSKIWLFTKPAITQDSVANMVETLLDQASPNRTDNVHAVGKNRRQENDLQVQ